jgi:hypothetical protein
MIGRETAFIIRAALLLAHISRSRAHNDVCCPFLSPPDTATYRSARVVLRKGRADTRQHSISCFAHCGEPVNEGGKTSREWYLSPSSARTTTEWRTDSAKIQTTKRETKRVWGVYHSLGVRQAIRSGNIRFGKAGTGQHHDRLRV